jgi:hypothetical protein
MNERELIRPDATICYWTSGPDTSADPGPAPRRHPRPRRLGHAAAPTLDPLPAPAVPPPGPAAAQPPPWRRMPGHQIRRRGHLGRGRFARRRPHQVDALNSRYRLVVPDLRGHGASDEALFDYIPLLRRLGGSSLSIGPRSRSRAGLARPMSSLSNSNPATAPVLPPSAGRTKAPG